MSFDTATFLLVEDDDIDVFLLRKTLSDLRIANPVIVASDGVEALDVLRGSNGQTRLAQPYIVLLDLNMPRMSGLEFLDEIAGDDELKDSTIFVMTTSASEDDRYKAYKQQIAGYILKSDAKDTLKRALAMLDQCWTSIVVPQNDG
jgi:hypothetical protein